MDEVMTRLAALGRDKSRVPRGDGRFCEVRQRVLLPLLLPNSLARGRTGQYEARAAGAERPENTT